MVSSRSERLMPQALVLLYCLSIVSLQQSAKINQVQAFILPVTRVCFNSASNSFQSGCIYCDTWHYTRTLMSCTGQPTLASNLSQAQAFCLATTCLQVSVLSQLASPLKRLSRQPPKSMLSLFRLPCDKANESEKKLLELKLAHRRRQSDLAPAVSRKKRSAPGGELVSTNNLDSLLNDASPAGPISAQLAKQDGDSVSPAVDVPPMIETQGDTPHPNWWPNHPTWWSQPGQFGHGFSGQPFQPQPHQHQNPLSLRIRQFLNKVTARVDYKRSLLRNVWHRLLLPRHQATPMHLSHHHLNHQGFHYNQPTEQVVLDGPAPGEASLMMEWPRFKPLQQTGKQAHVLGRRKKRAASYTNGLPPFVGGGGLFGGLNQPGASVYAGQPVGQVAALVQTPSSPLTLSWNYTNRSIQWRFGREPVTSTQLATGPAAAATAPAAAPAPKPAATATASAPAPAAPAAPPKPAAPAVAPAAPAPSAPKPPAAPAPGPAASGPPSGAAAPGGSAPAGGGGGGASTTAAPKPAAGPPAGGPPAG